MCRARALAMLALEIATRDRRRWRGGRRSYIRRPRARYTRLVTFGRLRSTTERDNIGPGSLRGSSCLPSRDGEPGAPERARARLFRKRGMRHPLCRCIVRAIRTKGRPF